MGRKIPGKKHRGVKDPYKQQEVRLNKVKNKLNAAPKSIDAQEIPRRLLNIAKYNKPKQKKDLAPAPKKKKKKLKKGLIDGRKFVDREREEAGMTRPTKLVPLLQQHPRENDKRFLRRVERATKEVLKESAFEDQFQVEVQRDMQGQVVSVNHREKMEPLLSEKQQQDITERRERKKQARRERDQRRRGKKRKNNDEDDDEFSYYQDKFEFGEVVYEPPSLDTEKLTRKVNGGMTKPKSGFLFMEKLKKKEEESPASSSSGRAGGQGQVMAGRKRMLEQERVRVVEEYRKMKASKQPPLSLSPR